MYTPVFAQILDSSLMQEDLETRWLFLTMLILADEAQTGVVDMPVDRLAMRASLSVVATTAALERLKTPDPDSRSEDEDGRRIIPMPRETGFSERGWIVVNWEKYKFETRAAIRRGAVRAAVNQHRHKKRGCAGCEVCTPSYGNQAVEGVNGGKQVKARVIKSNPSEAEATTEPTAATPEPPQPSSLSTKTRSVPPPDSGGRKTNRKFEKPPTLGETQKYWAEAELSGDPQQFWDYNGARGWHMKSGPIRDWKAAARYWSRNSKKFSGEGEDIKYPSFEDATKGVPVPWTR